MATTDVFRGLAQTNLDAYGPPDAADPYVAAFPTFRTFTPAGGNARDELILLRASVVSMQALRLVNTIGPGTLDFWDENNIPQVFRSVNSPGRRGGFPTFTYGRNSSGRFMNAALLKTGFRLVVVPPTTPGFEIPTSVELMCSAAQTWAEANGHRAAFPTFTLDRTRQGLLVCPACGGPHAAPLDFQRSARPAGSRVWRSSFRRARSEPDLHPGRRRARGNREQRITRRVLQGR